MSNEDLQAKINQKNKLAQDKKKLIQNLKNLDQVQKEVQLEIDKIMPEKTKFEEWARYFGNDGKSKQVLGWFSDELKKHQAKLERVQNMRDKILGVQNKLDVQIEKIEREIQDFNKPKVKPRSSDVVLQPGINKNEARKMDSEVFSKSSGRNKRRFHSKYELKHKSKSSIKPSQPSKKEEPFVDSISAKFRDEDGQKNQETSSVMPVKPATEKSSPLDAFKMQMRKSGLTAGKGPQEGSDRPGENREFPEVKSQKIAEELPVTRRTEAQPGTSREKLVSLDASDQPSGRKVISEKTKRDVSELNPSEIISGKETESRQHEKILTEKKTSFFRKEPRMFSDVPEKNQTNKEKSIESSHKKVSDMEMRMNESKENLNTMEKSASHRPQSSVREEGRRGSLKSLFGRFTSKPSEEKKREVPPEIVKEHEPKENKNRQFDEKVTISPGMEQKYSYIQQQPLRAKATENKIVDEDDINIGDAMEKEERSERLEVEHSNISRGDGFNMHENETTETGLSEIIQEVENLDEIEADYSWMEQEEKPEVKREIMTPGIKAETLYLGIDLGTYETTIAASNGMVASTVSAVGWAKDIVSKRFLKQDILFGAEAMKNKLALDFYRPLEDGVIKETERDQEAARELIKHVLKLVKPENYKKVYAVIGAPAQASLKNQQAILDAAREIIDAVTIISEPFAVAYGEANIYNTLVIDIGAGTTDLCRLRGTMPAPEDQITMTKAGDYIDYQLIESIQSRIKGAQVSKDMVRRWKEAYSFVMKPPKPIIVEVTVDGKPLKVDITASILKSCEAIVGDIEANVTRLISTFDPEFQPALKQNILLAGGGSLIRNLDTFLEQRLKPLGHVRIKKVRNPIEAGAIGALSLAMDVTDEYWRGL